MNNSALHISLSVLILVLGVILLSPQSAKTATGQFALLYSNDVRGETEPCG
jgi:hypothetical protein